MKSVTYSSGGIFHRKTLRFLVHDDRARAAFMFFRLTAPAAVEHYWSTVYTLADMEPLLSKDERQSVYMQWVKQGGRPVSDTTRTKTSNTYLDMSQWGNVHLTPSVVLPEKTLALTPCAAPGSSAPGTPAAETV